jgi:hypothetical protein
VFGKRRFALMIIISIFLSIIFELITHVLSGYLLSVSIVGYTIAGLIANDFYKQGVKKTLPSLVKIRPLEDGKLPLTLAILCAKNKISSRFITLR